jgi:hypothetical protein
MRLLALAAFLLAALPAASKDQALHGDLRKLQGLGSSNRSRPMDGGSAATS